MKRTEATRPGDLDKVSRKIDFEAIVANSPEAIIVEDGSGRIKYANRATLEMFGCGIEELRTVKNAIALLIPDGAARRPVLAGWKKDKASGAKSPLSFSGTTKSGRQVRFCSRHCHLPGGDVVTTMQDLSGIGLTEGRFCAILDNAPMPAAIVNMNGRIEYFNAKVFEAFGYTPQEIPTMEKWRLRAYPDRNYRDEVRKRWDGLVTNARANGRGIEASEYIVTCKDKSVKTMLIFGAPMAGKMVMMFQDITPRKEAQETFRNLAEQSPSMIFINQRGRVVFANKKCEETMGYTCAEICSPGFNFMNLIAPECHALTKRAFKTHSMGRDVSAYKYTILTRAKQRIPAVISTKLILYEGQRAILGVVTDVSALKHAEEKLGDAAGKLREQKKELEGKNAALKEVLAQIETEKLEIKQQVAANATKFIVPIVQKMRQKAGPMERLQCDLLLGSVEELTSRFGINLGGGSTALSAREMEVCNMIKNGMSSKEVAQSLMISLRTVDTFRNRIRRKLGVANKDVNLFAHLQTLT